MDYERLAYCCRERSKREMEDATQITLEEAATAITDLLARAEEAEKERDEEKQRRLYAESHAEAFLKDCEDLNNKLEIMDAENKRYAQLCNAQDKRIDELQSMAEEHKTKKDTAIRLIETIMGSQKYCALSMNRWRNTFLNVSCFAFFLIGFALFCVGLYENKTATATLGWVLSCIVAIIMSQEE